jgi:soluble lytic murein transglycosylase
MNSKRGPIGCVIAGALALAACVSAGSVERVSSAGAAPASGSPNAALVASYPVASIAPARGDFAAGYEAYTLRDYASAIEHLAKALAGGDPALGDYANFYLGSAQRDSGDLASAARSFDSLVQGFPQSVFFDRAQYQLADIALARNDPQRARAILTQLLGRRLDADTEQQALLLAARAAAALADTSAEYQALQATRIKFPRSAVDAPARRMERALLAAHPELANTASFDYQRSQADLLIREGQDEAALEHIDAALALTRSSAQRAEMLWLRVMALKSNPVRQRTAIDNYLKRFPKGASAPEALELKGRIQWRENDLAGAIVTFSRLTRKFPSSAQAPGAMLRIARLTEEQGELAAARLKYEDVVASYPHSEAATDARFRAPWMLYLLGNYSQAAERFGARRAAASSPQDRDMFSYWQARSLEKSGDKAAADASFVRLAAGTDSNYYPLLAGVRVDGANAVLPAARLPDLAPLAPPAMEGSASFHMQRVMALRTTGLPPLETAELLALREDTRRYPSLRDFLLAEFQAASDYYNAIQLASQMAESGELDHDHAERIRYPRAYWELIEPASERTGIDSYLLLALTRQESLFNPHARSVSDAQGLMQLLPTTAERVARQDGIEPGDLDLFDPALNVRLGTSYLRELMQMFNGNRFKAVAAYNAGEHAVEQWNEKSQMEDDEWVEQIDFRETRDYVKKVIGGTREYGLLYENAAPRPSASTQS